MKQRANSFRKLIAKVLVCTFLVSLVVTPKVSAAAKTVEPQISKKKVEMVVGGTYDLNIKNKVKKSTYTWTVSKKSVATVSNVGVVKALKKGKVVVTCKVKTPKGSYVLKSNVTVREGAEEFTINNKVQTLNVGQKYNLNRTLKPATSNDLTTWKSSDTSIAQPDNRGKFTALKEGTVTITGSTLSGKKDSVTIQVVDKEGTVTTQEELTKLLGTGAQKITIKTDSSVTFNIPEGNYSKQKLVVDAPNADVVNKGVFKSIDIKNIKATTWYENAIGNKINVTAPNASIRIEGNASAAIVVSNAATNLNLVNNGAEGSTLTLNAAATVTISGTSTALLPVVANAANAIVTSSIPLALTCNERIILHLNAGAEGTTINAVSNAAIPALSGTVRVTVTVGSGSNAQTIDLAPTNNNVGGGSGTGGNPGSGGNPGTGDEPGTTPGENTDPVPSTLGTVSGRVTAVTSSPINVEPATGGAIEPATGGAIEPATGGAIEPATGGVITVTPVSGATVYLLKYDGDIASAWDTIMTSPNAVLTTTDSQGLYTVNNLEPGNYVVAMAKEGYQVLNQLIKVVADTTTIVNGNLIEISQDGTTSGRAKGSISDAITGDVVNGDLTFTIKVYKNFNNTAEADLVTTITATGSEYVLDLPEGYYTIMISDDREASVGVTYATTTMNIVVLGGTEFSNQDIVLSTYKQLGQATFVLTWDEYPLDLDSHLFGPVEGNNDYHIYYSNRTFPESYENIIELHLRLDRDDQDSYGPETTSVYVPVVNGIYTFVVYNYSGNYDCTLAKSGAKVVVTTSTETATFQVPTGAEEGTWVVCTYNSATNQITPINKLLDTDEYLGHNLRSCDRE